MTKTTYSLIVIKGAKKGKSLILLVLLNEFYIKRIMIKNTSLIKENSSFNLLATAKDEGSRTDKFIANQFLQYSRSFLQKLFAQKKILLNGSTAIKASYCLKNGDEISISFPKQDQPIKKSIPNDLGVKIIAQEEDFFIIYKPAGLIVHPPNATCQEITLSDWLAHTYSEIAHVGMVDRPGIVHRLDKETSGLMIIPRTNHAHATMTQMFKNRTIKKTYLAIVSGHPEPEGSINYLIGRHPTVRNKMHYFTELTKQPSSKEASSHYKVLNYFKDCSLLEVQPKTGRTHQIRVHCAAIGHPLLADPIYGTSSKRLARHALHAHKLKFSYKNKQYEFSSNLDQDLQNYLDQAEPLKI